LRILLRRLEFYRRYEFHVFIYRVFSANVKKGSGAFLPGLKAEASGAEIR
jgi:hypothetical protein